MSEFKLKCPINYPIQCNLQTPDKDVLNRSEKYKGFLMYQFKDQDLYAIKTIKSYFKIPLYYLYDADLDILKSCLFVNRVRMVSNRASSRFNPILIIP